MVSMDMEIRRSQSVQYVKKFMFRNECSFLLDRLAYHHKTTYDHSIRVAEYCHTMASALPFDQDETDVLVRSALLHDVGKLQIPNTLLNKKEALSAEDWKVLRAHPQSAADMLRHWIDDGLVDEHVILYHHENLDGTGYYGLTEAGLNRSCKLIRIADSFDAMTENRLYNKAKTSESALNELYRWSGKMYDEKLVRLFHEILANNTVG